MEKFWANTVGSLFGRGLAGVYDIMIELSSAFFNSSLLENVSLSVYTIVGVFILFRLVVSALTYLVDPDKVSDKQIGAGKLLVRIVVSIALLLTLPNFIFPLLHDVQDMLTSRTGILMNLFNDIEINDKIINPISNQYRIGNSNLVWQNVKAETSTNGERPLISNSATSCTKEYGYSGSVKDFTPKMSNFNDMYAGCSMGDVKARFQEYLNYFNSHKINVNPQACPDLDFSSCRTAGWGGAITDGYKANKYSSTSCNGERNCYNIELNGVASYSDDYIFLGFDDDSLDNEGYFTCMDHSTGANDDSGCLSFTLHADVKIPEQERNSFSCTYIFRDSYDDLLVANSDTHTCNNIRYLEVKDRKITVVFTPRDDANPIFDPSLFSTAFFNKKTDGSLKWDITVNTDTGVHWNVTGKKIIASYGAVDMFAALDKGLSEVSCPASIIGLDMTRRDPSLGGYSITVNDDFDGNIMFSDKSWVAIDQYNKYSGLTNYGQSSWENIQGRYIDDVLNNVCNEDADVRDDLNEAIDGGYEENYGRDCDGNKYSGICFSKDVIKAFIKKDPKKCESSCEKIYDNFLNSSSDNSAFGKLLKNGDLQFDSILAIVFAIIAIFLMAVICIEVVVRGIKLWLLESIAPIAVVSYINPSDKVFGQWTKMYFSAYCDIFLKLISVSAGVKILAEIPRVFDSSGFAKIFTVLGVLIFMKSGPNFISKIFGLSGDSTFKESMNMVKAGLGVAAGGAIGATVASATAAPSVIAAKGWKNKLGAIAQGVGTVASSSLLGLGGGARGKLFAGSKHASEINRKRTALYTAGVGFGTQLDNTLFGAVGLDYALQVDKQVSGLRKEQNEVDSFESYKKNIDSIADGSKDLTTFSIARTNGKIQMTDQQYAKVRENWINAQTSGKEVSYSRLFVGTGLSGEQVGNILETVGYITTTKNEQGRSVKHVSTMQIDEGRRNVIRRELGDAQVNLQRFESIHKVAESRGIENINGNYGNLVKLTAGTKDRAGEIQSIIRQKTELDPKYVESLRAKQNGNNAGSNIGGGK